jgi:hypothetical protein
MSYLILELQKLMFIDTRAQPQVCLNTLNKLFASSGRDGSAGLHVRGREHAQLLFRCCSKFYRSINLSIIYLQSQLGVLFDVIISLVIVVEIV